MMKRYKQIFLVAALSALFLGASAAVPTGYYASLKGKSSQDLKNAVKNVVRPHTKLTYNSLWDYFPYTDAYPNSNQMWDMYSNNKYYYPNKLSGVNREHSLPKSWWGGTENEAYTDINHLYPADGPANSAKSNYPLGEVSGTPKYNNGVTKVGSPKPGQGGGCNQVFEPADEYKGDFARTYFYMATCYSDLNWKYTYMLSNASWMTLTGWAYQMLLDWSRKDPVSQKEIDRNEQVYKAQNNRNPFIDNPGLEEYIWGNKAGQAFDPGVGPDPGTKPELFTPTQGTNINFGEIAIGESVTADLYVRGTGLKGSLSLTIYSGDSKMFSVPVSGIGASMANSADGYLLKITYKPTEVGTHTSRLVFSDGGLEGSVGVSLSGVCAEVPVLPKPQALEAQNVGENSFTASWNALSELVDSYQIEVKGYQGTALVSEDIVNVDIEELPESSVLTYDIEDLNPACTYTYRVRAERIGVYSAWSNAINVDFSGVSSLATQAPLSIVNIEGGVLVRVSDMHHNACIYNLQGQLVMRLGTLEDNQEIYLPAGVYNLVTAESRRAHKLLVR